jgi:RNA 2',3'-cyclic 3'-phosphodiesterase
MSLLISDITGFLPLDGGWRAHADPRFELAERQPRASDPVFFLLYPPANTAKQIRQLALLLGKKHGLQGQPPAAERLHISLLGLGPYGRLTRGAVAAIHEAAASITMPPFAVAFDYAMNFGRAQGPLVLCGSEGVAGITMLRRELLTAMSKIGFRGSRSFEPHVTLLYQDCKVPEQAVKEIRWTVCEHTLVCSLRSRHRHVELGRWPLRGGQ